MSDTNKFPPMNRTELARKYKVSLPTFNKWLGLISNLVLIENQRIFTPKQVELIINHLGEPLTDLCKQHELTSINSN
jgi:hypothetical protein